MRALIGQMRGLILDHVALAIMITLISAADALAAAV
jgi:hypothetical protein